MSEQNLESKRDLIAIILYDVQHRDEYDTDWQNGYIPKLSSYLKGRRWEDEFKVRTVDPNASAAGIELHYPELELRGE